MNSKYPGKEKLELMYVEFGLTTAQIAQFYRVRTYTAHKWLKKAQVEARARGPKPHTIEQQIEAACKSLAREKQREQEPINSPDMENCDGD